MELKKDIRKRILLKRNEMSAEDWTYKSTCIFQRVVSHSMFQSSDAVYCYMDYRNEVETRQIIQEAWKQQKKVAVPRVNDDAMEFYYIHTFSDLTEGFRGVLEPASDSIATDENVLVIMPGSVYDKQGHRIGYGKGYYDKYLHAHSSYKTMALAFGFQVLDQIPNEPYDVIPDVLITEEKIYEFKHS